jgi:hypothetical protein
MKPPRGNTRPARSRLTQERAPCRRQGRLNRGGLGWQQTYGGTNFPLDRGLEPFGKEGIPCAFAPGNARRRAGLPGRSAPSAGIVAAAPAGPLLLNRMSQPEPGRGVPVAGWRETGFTIAT